MFIALVKTFLLYFAGTETGEDLVAILGLTVFLPKQMLLNVGS